MNIQQILLWRGQLIKAYKRHETAASYGLKFFAGLVIFMFINSIKLYHADLDGWFSLPMGLFYILLSALLFAVLPLTFAHFLIVIELTLQFSASPEAAAIIFFFLSLILIFYCRLQPKKSFLLIAVVMGFYLKVPYAVVLFAGLYLGLSSIIPVVIGTFIYYFIPVISDAVRLLKTPAAIDMMKLPENVVSVYQELYIRFTDPSNFGWLFTGFSFAMVIVAVYAVSRLSINYSKEAALLMGAAVNLICGITGYILNSLHTGIIMLIISTVFSTGIVFVIRFFDSFPDYKKAEYTQFEDDENCYYVKIVPKKIR